MFLRWLPLYSVRPADSAERYYFSGAIIHAAPWPGTSIYVNM